MEEVASELRGEASRKLIELKAHLKETFPAAHAEREGVPEILETGVSGLDEVGIPKGRLVELEVPRAGGMLLFSACLCFWKGQGQHVVFLDGRDGLDPQSLDAGSLDSLLWVRCHDLQTTLRAADLFLRDGNLPVVWVDMVLASSRERAGVPGHAWQRLRKLAWQTGVTCLVVTPAAGIPAADIRIEVPWTPGLESLYEERRKLVSRMPIRVKRNRVAYSGMEDREGNAWKEAG